MTREEFLSHEIYTWGEEYIFDLLDKGYSLIETDHGWKWQLPQVTRVTQESQVDTAPSMCYATGVGPG